MPDVWFAVPGEPTQLTGGYLYARRLIDALPATGWFAHQLRLPDGFPSPTSDELTATHDILNQLPRESVVLADGLAFGALPRDMLESLDLNFVALVHHPLADESGLSPALAETLRRSEREALSTTRAVVAPSPHTAETLIRDYGVARESMYIAPPGTDPASRARGHIPPRLLTVATLTYRKGHDVLIEALAQIKDLDWSSVLVGSLERDPVVAANVKTLVEKYGLGARVTFSGELDNAALDAAYDASSLFVLPSRHEGYGMVFAEALARGLPIVACAAGAVTETVPADAGLLVPPDDPGALADALRRVLVDESFRRNMGDAAWRHGQKLPTWADTAAQVSEALWTALP